jgi:hypothetical protein
MRNTTAWMNRGNLWRYPRPLSCADCNKSKCHHRLSRVNKFSYFEVSTRRHLSLSLSEIVTSMLIFRCQAIVSLSHTHTHRRLDAYFQVLKHRLSLSHRIVTSMLISRCQTIAFSLSHSQNCHLDAYFQVSNHRLSLSLSQNCHLDVISRCQTILSLSLTHRHTIVTPTLISSCQTIVSLSQRSSPRCLFPGAEPSSLSLSHRDRDVDFLPAHTNKQSAGNANALCVAVAPWSLSALNCVTRRIRNFFFS